MINQIFNESNLQTYIINNYFNIKQIINNKRRNNKNSDTDK